MFDFMARVDLFELPFGKFPYHNIFGKTFKLPGKRALKIYVDYTKHMAVGLTSALNFKGSYNFLLGLNVLPFAALISIEKDWGAMYPPAPAPVTDDNDKDAPQPIAVSEPQPVTQ